MHETLKEANPPKLFFQSNFYSQQTIINNPFQTTNFMSDFSPTEIQYYFAFVRTMSQHSNPSDHSIFLSQHLSENCKGSQQLDSQLFHGMVYVDKGDTSPYISQFLHQDCQSSEKWESTSSRVEQFCPKGQEQSKVDKEQQRECQDQEKERMLQESSQENLELSSSTCHSFQKHLINGLKKTIVFKVDHSTPQQVVVASKLWQVFRASKVCTKKMMHCLLGNRNEYRITDSSLRYYGFLELYSSYGSQLISKSRKFLLKQVLQQLKHSNCLQPYIQQKRLKSKQKFRKYASMFVEQLQSGCLRKRMTRGRQTLPQP